MRALFVVAAVGGTLAGCSSMPPEALAPVGEIESGPAGDLSGDYCFSGDPAALHAFGRGLNDLPFLEWARVAPGSLVRLSHKKGHSLEFTYTAAEGGLETKVFDLRREGVRWDGGRLVYRPPAANSGVRLGLSSSKFEIAVYRLRDGRLVVHSLSSEAGLAFLVVPFRERYEVFLELNSLGPAGCEARPASSERDGPAPAVSRGFVQQDRGASVPLPRRTQGRSG